MREKAARRGLCGLCMRRQDVFCGAYRTSYRCVHYTRFRRRRQGLFLVKICPRRRGHPFPILPKHPPARTVGRVNGAAKKITLPPNGFSGVYAGGFPEASRRFPPISSPGTAATSSSTAAAMKPAPMPDRSPITPTSTGNTSGAMLMKR